MADRDSRLELSILGAGPSWPNPDGACSGYLLSAAGSHLLLECGPGVAGRLLAQVSLSDLAGIVISHMHPDHMLDLVPLRQGVRYGPLRRDPPLPVLVPPEGAGILSELGRAIARNERFFSDSFDVREYEPAAVASLGPFSIGFRQVQHSIACYATRIGVGPAGIEPDALAFSGDAARCDALIEQARGVGTLLCEATLERTDQGDADPAKRDHMSAAEAGEVARRAEVGRLLLTHMALDPVDPDRPVRDAAAIFGGPVERAVEGQRYTL